MGDLIKFPKKHQEEIDYERKYRNMDKFELLEEMTRFQEKRTEAGKMSPELVRQGIPLFAALRDAAETHELRLLASSYYRHLKEGCFDG